MTIGQVAKASGVSTSAIRFYESEGILPKPPRKSGRREYDDATVELLQILRFFRSSGFSIRDLKAMSAADIGLSTTDRASVVRRRIAELDEYIQEASTMRTRLHSVLACECHGDKTRCVIFA